MTIITNIVPIGTLYPELQQNFEHKGLSPNMLVIVSVDVQRGAFKIEFSDDAKESAGKFAACIRELTHDQAQVRVFPGNTSIHNVKDEQIISHYCLQQPTAEARPLHTKKYSYLLNSYSSHHQRRPSPSSPLLAGTTTPLDDDSRPSSCCRCCQ
ncbi:MAG: hypothetical protein K0S08_2108 [Gammaproteobacteria bacterium]|nr:hypothetical protein [Gammaproteobacteria bacterium]